MDPYRKNVDILRKNRENVPLAELKTKYANGYLQICEKIKEQTKSAISALIADGMIILEADRVEELPKIVSEVKKIIDQETAAGTIKEISRLIFSEFNVDKAMDLAAEKLARPAFEKAYGPYFRKKCRLQEGRYVCDLLPGMAWNEEYGVWMTADGMSFTLMLPPIQRDGKENEDGNQENYE